MESQNLIWKKTDGIGLLTLNRPDKFNSFNSAVLQDLIKLLQEVADDDAVKTLVITGAGKAFSAGADLEGHPVFEATDMATIEGFVREGGMIPLLLHKIMKPTIAAVNGIAAGAGLNLAGGCDIRIASERAKFAALFAKIGLAPDMGGSWTLPRLVGLAKALEMSFTGDMIDAAEAYRIGLVNHVVPHEELMNTAMDLAGRFAKGPSLSYRFTKWSLYKGLDDDLPTAIENEVIGQSQLVKTEDVQLAVKSFLEKKTPVFKGR